LTGPPAGQPPFGVAGTEMDGKINGDMVKVIGDTERVADGSGIQNSKEESKNDITYGWEQRIDPATHNPMYLKPATGEITTIRPCGGWEEMRDPATGNKYYGNILTGASSWTMPPEMGGQKGQLDDSMTVTDDVLTPRQLASKKEAQRIANIEAAYLRSPLGWQRCQEDCKNPSVSCWQTCINCNERSMEMDRQYMHEDILEVDAIAECEGIKKNTSSLLSRF